jgi:hypothetical protein
MCDPEVAWSCADDVSVQCKGALGVVSGSPVALPTKYLETMAACNSNLVVVDPGDVSSVFHGNAGSVVAFTERSSGGCIGSHLANGLVLLKLMQLCDLTGLAASTPTTVVKMSGEKNVVVGVYEKVYDTGARGGSGSLTGMNVPRFLSTMGDVSAVLGGDERLVSVPAVQGFLSVFPVESLCKGERVRTVFNVLYVVARPGIDLFGLLDRCVTVRISRERLPGRLDKEKSDELVRRAEVLKAVQLTEASNFGLFRPGFSSEYRVPAASGSDDASPYNMRNLCNPTHVLEKISALLDGHVDVRVPGFPDMFQGGGDAERGAAREAYSAMRTVSLKTEQLYVDQLRKTILDGGEFFYDGRLPQYFVDEGGINCVYFSNIVLWFSNLSMVSPWDMVSGLYVKEFPTVVKLPLEMFLRGDLDGDDSGELDSADPRYGSESDLMTEVKREQRYGPLSSINEYSSMGGYRHSDLIAMERYVLNRRCVGFSGSLDSCLRCLISCVLCRQSGVLTPCEAARRMLVYFRCQCALVRTMISDDRFESDFLRSLDKVVGGLLNDYAPHLTSAVVMYGLPVDRRVYATFASDVEVVRKFEDAQQGCTSDGVTRVLYERSLGLISDPPFRVLGDYAAASEAFFCVYEWLNSYMLMNMINLMVFLELLTSSVGFYLGTLNDTWVWFGWTIHILGGFGHLRREVEGKFVVVVEKPNTSGVDTVILRFFKRLYGMALGLSDVSLQLLRDSLVIEVLQLERATDGAMEQLGRVTVSERGVKLSSPVKSTHARLVVNTELRNVTPALLNRFVTSLPRSLKTSDNVVLSTRDPFKTNEREQTMNIRMDGFLVFFLLMCTNCHASVDVDEPWQSLWTVVMLLPSGVNDVDISVKDVGKRRKVGRGGFSGESSFPPEKTPVFDRVARAVSLVHLGSIVHVALANKLMACRFELNTLTVGLIGWISNVVFDYFSSLFGDSVLRDRDRLISMMRSRAVSTTLQKTYLLELTRASTYEEAVSRTYASLTCNAVEVRDVWQALHMILTRYVDFRLLTLNQLLLGIMETPIIPFPALLRFLSMPDDCDAGQYRAWEYYDDLRGFVVGLFESGAFVSARWGVDADVGNNISPCVTAPLHAQSFMNSQLNSAKGEGAAALGRERVLSLCAEAMFREYGSFLRTNAGFPYQSSTCVDMLRACACRYSVDFTALCGGNSRWHSVASLMRKLGIPETYSQCLYGRQDASLGFFVRPYLHGRSVGGVAVHIVQHLVLSALVGDDRVTTAMAQFASKTVATTVMQMLPPRVSGMNADINQFEGDVSTLQTRRLTMYRRGVGGVPALNIMNCDHYVLRSAVVVPNPGDTRAERLLCIPYQRYAVEDAAEFRTLFQWCKLLAVGDLRQFPYHLQMVRVPFTPGVVYPLLRNRSQVVDAELPDVEEDVAGCLVLYATELDDRSDFYYDVSDSVCRVLVMSMETGDNDEQSLSLVDRPACMVHDVLAEQMLVPSPVVTRPCAAIVIPGRSGCVGVVRSFAVGCAGALWRKISSLVDGVPFEVYNELPTFFDTGLARETFSCLDVCSLAYTVRTYAVRASTEAPLVEEDVSVSFVYAERNLVRLGDVVLVAYDAFEELGFGVDRFLPLSFNTDRGERAMRNHFLRFVRCTLVCPTGADMDTDRLYVSVQLRARVGRSRVRNTHCKPGGGSVCGLRGVSYSVFAVRPGFVFHASDAGSSCPYVADYIYSSL